jgi:hypothetical protein
MNDPFYIGYEPQALPPIRRTARRTVLALAGLAVTVAVILVSAQAPFADSRFEYGVLRDYEGQLVEWPYPMLVTAQARFLLVAPGKFGASDLVRGHDGETLRVTGTLIERRQDKMLQVEPESLVFTGSPRRARGEPMDLGSVTLTGEIIDTKCFLGVMNPGEGKVHRDCAVRCISGGVPPGFLVRDASGDARVLLLVGGDGRQIGREVLDFVAEPITIRGRLVRSGPTLVLQAEPRDFRRE